MKKLIITFEVPVYKDRSKNPKHYIYEEIKTNQIDDNTWRVRPEYGHIDGYIEQICIQDTDKKGLEDVTEKYKRSNFDGSEGTQNLRYLISDIFRDNGVKW